MSFTLQLIDNYPVAKIAKFIKSSRIGLKRINSNHGKTVIPLIMTSSEALKKVEDTSLDFVFIDADHTYEAVKFDIANWYKKLKINGLLAGHDYGNINSVTKAIEDYFGSNFNHSIIDGIFYKK